MINTDSLITQTNLKVSGAIPRRFCISQNQKQIAQTSQSAIQILDVQNQSVVNIIIISDHDIDNEMFSKWQVTGIQLGPISYGNIVQASTATPELIAVVINCTQICMQDLHSGKQVWRRTLEEKDDILEIYWNQSRDALFILFVTHQLKCLQKASSAPMAGNDFEKFSDIYDTSCYAFHPRNHAMVAFGQFKYTRIYLYNIDSKTNVRQDYTSEDWEIETSCIAYDPNHEEQLYIGATDNCIYLVNFKDNFQIFKQTCFDSTPQEIIPNPLKIGYYTVNLKQKQDLQELQSASNKIQNVIRINGNQVSNHVNLALDQSDPKNWKGDILISTKSGSIIIYNMLNKCIKYMSDPSHQDTIFDAKVTDNYLCSCSFLGEVKIFNCYTHKEVQSQQTQDMINNKNNDSVYHISLSPLINGKQQLCGITQLGFIQIWGVNDPGNKPLMKQSFSEKRALICSWNQMDWTKLALGSESMKTGLVLNLTMKMVNNKFKGFIVDSIVTTQNDGKSVQGVCFGTLPENRNVLLTCASDGKLRLFSPPYNKAFCEINAHSNRAFNGKFSPHYQNIIVSVSDDKTVSVSNQETRMRDILIGHKNKIRGLEFCHGIKDIVITGDWNGQILIWNFVSKTKVQEQSVHSNDVQGIASCPQYPLSIWTSSRDSTIRTHNLSRLKMDFFISKLIEYYYKVKVDFESSVSQDGNSIHDLLELYISNPAFRSISGIINQIKDHKNINLSCVVQHQEANNQVQQLILEEKQQKEASKIINPNKQANIKAIADEFLGIGAIDKFCDLNFESKNQEKALIFAPAVGIDQWKKLMQRQITEVLKPASLDEQQEYGSIIGDWEDALNKKNDYKNSSLNLINSITTGHFPSLDVNVTKGMKFKKYRFYQNKIIKQMVTKEMNSFNPQLAIAYYLSIENVDSALALAENINDFMLCAIIAAVFQVEGQFENQLDMCIVEFFPVLSPMYIKELIKTLNTVPAMQNTQVKLCFLNNLTPETLVGPIESSTESDQSISIILKDLEKKIESQDFEQDKLKNMFQIHMTKQNVSILVTNGLLMNAKYVQVVTQFLQLAIVKISEEMQQEMIQKLAHLLFFIQVNNKETLKDPKKEILIKTALIKMIYASYQYSDGRIDTISDLSNQHFGREFAGQISHLTERINSARRTGDVIMKQHNIHETRRTYAYQKVGENLPIHDEDLPPEVKFYTNLVKLVGFCLEIN